MSQPLLIDQQTETKRVKPSRNRKVTHTPKSPRLDAYTVASNIQRAQDKRELLYGYVTLFMKLGLLSIFFISFIKVGLAAHQRVFRQAEIVSLLKEENIKFERLRNRFDLLFTINGNDRFMKEQDQWIAPNSVRVIWR